MAVRFDADTESYTRTISLGSITQFSFACWFKISVDRNATSAILSLDDGFSTTRSSLQTASDGTTLNLVQGTNPRGLGAMTVGTWCYVGISVNGVNGTAVVQGATDAAATVTTWSDGQASTTANTFQLDANNIAGQFLNGCIAAVKLWPGATLSQSELEAEIWTYMPRRTANLAAWYPLLAPSTVDLSGNGSTLSGGTGTSTEDGPPISWGPRRRTVYAPAPTSTLISLADSATAADSLTADVDAPLADSATAADTLSVAATTALADTAVADEQMTVVVTVDLADAATADDVAIVGNPVSLADSATADDSWSTIPTPVLDEQATGDDTLTITATADFSDAATATDQITVAQTLPKDLTDAATASDSLTVVLLQDITVTASGARRGWAAGQLGDGWESGDLARSWTSSPAERSWPGGDPTRSWSARPPTT